MIESVRYINPEHTQVIAIIDGKETGIPVFEGSRHWRALKAEWLDTGNTIAPYVEPDANPVPQEISDRQFFQQLAIMGLITEEEALAAVKIGDMPAAFLAFIDALPEEQRFTARMLLEGATTFNRAHPLSAAFGAMHGMTEAQIDDLWRAASLL